MRLQDLFEGKQYDAAFCFGRFNPAHAGHIKVWQAAQSSSTNWFIATNPKTYDKKNPLPFDVKKSWIETIYPSAKGHILAEINIITTVAHIFNKLGKNEKSRIAYITDADDWGWSGPLLKKENGRTDSNHDYFKFASIDHVPSPRITSATLLRDAVTKDDPAAFYAASGTDYKLKVKGRDYFSTVKLCMSKF